MRLYVLLLIISGIETSHIKFIDNGYEDIVVAISSNIKPHEGEVIISKIKELFTNASRVLFTATRRLAYFRSIIILIPEKWPSKSGYETVGSETYVDSDVRVDLPNAMYGDGPYTLQPGLCGERGKYIHLTPGYLKFLLENSTTVFGDPGKTLIHEWAHFRYGVFDEFGIPNDPKYPVAYFDGKTLLPNACSNKEIHGYYWDMKTDQLCEFDANERPKPSCRFIPDQSRSDGGSSLSSFHFLPNVDSFCGTNGYKHDYYSPNKHNDLCDGMSAWDVIKMNEDFIKVSLAAASQSTTPTFHILQKKETAFVLVLDLSSSMNEDSKITLLQQAATRWLKYELRLRNAVGIVTFSNSARIVQPVVRVTDETVREEIIKKIPNTAGGHTCIGCGLHDAMIALRNYKQQRGGIIILLTDGQENKGPYIEAVQEEVVRQRVKVVTIAFTTHADPKIEKLAQLTRGKSFFVDMKSPTNALNSAFFESTTYQSTDEAHSLKIHESSFNELNRNYSGSFAIDDTIGSNTVIDVVYGKDRQNILDIHIVGLGKRFDLKNSEDEQLLKLVRFKFSTLEPGIYNYKITMKAHTQEEVVVSVRSQSRSSFVKPIITSCWMELKKLPNGLKPMVIYAEVKQGNNPILNAKVLAKVELPSPSPPVIMQLFDNGNGAPDSTRNDGIYSRYFTSFLETGRYSIQAQVTDNGNAVIQDIGFTASRSMPAANKYPLPDLEEAPLRDTGPFERVVTAGSILIDKAIIDIPPGDVKDLQIVHNQEGNSKITLQWTSPGDDLDNGTVSFYDIRISTRYEDLRWNFTQCSSINTTNLIPLPAGDTMRFTFDIPNFQLETTYYLALNAADDSGLTSRISNIAQVNIAPGIVKETPKDNSVIVIVALVIVFVISFIVAAFFIYKNKMAAKERKDFDIKYEKARVYDYS